MGKVSREGKGKTLYIQLSVYASRRTKSRRAKNLTISCPDKDTQFRITLTDNGLSRFRKLLEGFYEEQVPEPQTE